MSDAINPAMLTLAREARSIGQGELAERIGKTQGYLSKIENGVKELSDPDTVRRLASVLRFPVSFFYLASPVMGPGAGCHFRRRQAATITKLRELQARMSIARLRYERLLHGVEIETPLEFARMDIDDYDNWPEEIAAQLRAAWQVPFGPIANVTALIESAGGLVVKEPFGSDKVDEMSHWPAGHRPFFFMNSETPGDRYRWSLAHGLGHVVMHAVPAPDKEMEDQANRFASEFLAPAAEIGPELENLTLPKAAQLKMKWKMSIQAVVMRAHDLGQITDRQRRSFFTRLTQLGYRKQEPYPLVPEEPEMFKRLIEFHRDTHGYSISELADVAVVNEAEFSETYLGIPDSRLRVV